MARDDTSPMAEIESNMMQAGRDYAYRVRSKHGLCGLREMLDVVNSPPFLTHEQDYSAVEYWRGFRNEAAALLAIASRKAR